MKIPLAILLASGGVAAASVAVPASHASRPVADPMPCVDVGGRLPNTVSTVDDLLASQGIGPNFVIIDTCISPGE